jgi:hypothetical protein
MNGEGDDPRGISRRWTSSRSRQRSTADDVRESREQLERRGSSPRAAQIAELEDIFPPRKKPLGWRNPAGHKILGTFAHNYAEALFIDESKLPRGLDPEHDIRLPNNKVYVLDRIDWENVVVYEIKPDTPKSMAKGELQAKKYVAIMNKEYPRYHPDGTPHKWTYEVITYDIEDVIRVAFNGGYIDEEIIHSLPRSWKKRIPDIVARLRQTNRPATAQAIKTVEADLARRQSFPRARVIQRRGGKVIRVIEEVSEDIVSGGRATGKAVRGGAVAFLRTSRRIRILEQLIKNIILPPFTPWGIAGEILFEVVLLLIARYFEEKEFERAEEEAIRRTVQDLRLQMESYVDKYHEYLSKLYFRRWRDSHDALLLYVKINAEVIRERREIPTWELDYFGAIPTRTPTTKIDYAWKATARAPAEHTFERHWWDPSKKTAFMSKNGDKVFRFEFQAPFPILTPFDVLIATFDDLALALLMFEQSTPYRRQESDRAKRLIERARAELKTHQYEQDENNVALAEGILSLAALGRRYRYELILKVDKIYDGLMPVIHMLHHPNNPKGASDLANETIQILEQLNKEIQDIITLFSDPTTFIYLDDEWSRDVLGLYGQYSRP